MKGNLMGCATMDMHGVPLTLVIPDESVVIETSSDPSHGIERHVPFSLAARSLRRTV
jgi:hypothetical protein